MRGELISELDQRGSNKATLAIGNVRRGERRKVMIIKRGVNEAACGGDRGVGLGVREDKGADGQGEDVKKWDQHWRRP